MRRRGAYILYLLRRVLVRSVLYHCTHDDLCTLHKLFSAQSVCLKKAR